MRIINEGGEILEIKIDSFCMRNSKYGDCLKAELIITKDIAQFKKRLKFLIIEELEKAAQWIKEIRNNSSSTSYFLFTDPKMKLKLTKRCNIPFLKLIYEENERERETWDIAITKNNFNIIIGRIRECLENLSMGLRG